ncbi:MAG TPA: tetratricopeptide repeat protein [Planctomycetota bacterium]|jgi:tetratricopeptide (TPR) repeat protein
MRRYFRFLLLATLFSLPLFSAETDDAAAWGQENIAAGKYADAEDLLKKALGEQAADSPKRRDVALVLIEAYRIRGKLQDAQTLCADLLKANAKDTTAQSLNAELLCERGEYKQALEAFDKVISAEPDNQRAWALRVPIYRLFSDRENLKKTTDHFFELWNAKKQYFNSDDVKDPREYAYVALGIQNDEPQEAFGAYQDGEELAGKRRGPAPEIILWSARLAHEKYRFDLAAQRYAVLGKIRPKLPDALAGQAAIILQTMHKLDDVEKLLQDALAVNPNHVDSNLLAAGVDLEEDRYDDAKKHIDAALAVNPNHLHGLAMLAYYYLDIDQKEKAVEVEKRALALNPKCADFYCDIGEAMETKRGFNLAPAYYKKAIDLDPDYWRGYYGLGMSTSRQGAAGEAEGKRLLNKAFSKNKFNVWAKNMLQALDQLTGVSKKFGDDANSKFEEDIPPRYVSADTPHFTVKCNTKEEKIVLPYLQEWAENAYDWQTKKFKYEPQGPLSIELCYSFDHQAARTVGLPNLGALGVCFGKLCTVVSPREGKGNHPPFNWRKVLNHEFGHVMALQLSEFRVPRWYTEAFSTYLENDSRIDSDRMMVDAIAKGKLKNIDTMNEYFRGNMLMAYVHGRYVIEYIDKTFGFDAHLKALRAFAKGKKLEEALTEATGKSLKELNEGQLAYVKKFFENVRLKPMYDPASVVKLEMAAKKDDATAQNTIDYAFALLAGRRTAEAEALAKKALEKDANCVDAINLLGRVAYDKKDFEGAKQQFVKATGLDANRSFTAWHLLGIIYKKEGRTTKAIEALEAARKSYPRYVGPDNPHHVLPELYADLEPPQLDKALSVWKDAVKINTEDAEAALKGLRLAIQMKDWASAVELATAHIQIDPYVAEVHRLAGKSYEMLKDADHAAREYQVAVTVDDKDVESWVALARMHKAAGRREEALKAIEQALQVDGTHAEAKALRDSLK